MTVNNTATRYVYRPTMRRELLEPDNKGAEVIMVDANSNPVEQQVGQRVSFYIGE